jgi:hypothetical protein
MGVLITSHHCLWCALHAPTYTKSSLILQAITRIYGQLAAGKVVRVCAIVRDLCEAAFLCGICAVRRPSKPPRICAQFGSGSVLPKKVGSRLE